MESWPTWVAVLVAWLFLGLWMAYLFGRINRNDDASERDDLAPKVGYLRRAKRSKAPRGASTQIRMQRLFGGQRRH